MEALVTGATGFVGGRLARERAQASSNVVPIGIDEALRKAIAEQDGAAAAAVP